MEVGSINPLYVYLSDVGSYESMATMPPPFSSNMDAIYFLRCASHWDGPYTLNMKLSSSLVLIIVKGKLATWSLWII
jgi:hypothetical protein